MSVGSQAQSQTPTRPIKQHLEVYPGPRRMTLIRGDTVIVDPESAFVYNLAAEELYRTYRTLALTLQNRVKLGDSISRAQDSIIGVLKDISRIQDVAYATLRVRFDSVDTLARRSTRLTDRTLDYSRRVRATTYLTSAVMGGVAGGIAFKTRGQSGVSPLGFLVGAVAGVLTNGLIQKLVH